MALLKLERSQSAEMSLPSSSLQTNLIKLISQDHDLTSVFFYAPSVGKCRLGETLLAATLELPLVIWRSEKTLILNGFLGEGLLVLACLPGLQWRDPLSNLSLSMRYLRQARVLIELEVEIDNILAHQVLEFCQGQEMINTIAIFNDFAETQTVFSFNSYPQFEMLRNTFTPDTQALSLYPNKMLDLHGFKIRTMPDYSEPNTISYKDQYGNKQILGYLWDTLEAYAHKYNARLQVVHKYGDERTLNLREILDVAQSGIIDIAASLQPMAMGYYDRYHEISYPVELSSWCVMLPVERDLDVSELLSRLMPYPTIALLTTLWMCYKVLRGRWRRHQRLQTMGWLLLATLLSPNYLGRLLSLFADPPSVTPIDSLAAMMESPVRIFSIRTEYSRIDFSKRTKYSAAFRLTPTTKDMIQKRNAMDTSFAYTVTRSKWKLFEEQQRRSSRPLFRYTRSSNLCFYEMMLFGLVLSENSAHRASLHHTTLQLWESGLYNLWMSRGFFYMVKAGKLHIADLRGRYQANAIDMRDLKNVFKIYSAGMLSGLVLFVCELIVHFVKLWLGF